MPEDPIFQEPHCYVSGNNKAEVISFTSLCSLVKLLSLLSALSARDVKKFFRRTLTVPTRTGHKVELIVDDSRDFAFFYKFSSSRLHIQYHYGEWNAGGSCRVNKR